MRELVFPLALGHNPFSSNRVIAWIECAGRQPYIAGITNSVDEAVDIEATMPPHIARSSRVQYRADLDWPCFVVEGSDGFAFCAADEGTALIARYLQFGSLDDGDRNITVYRIVGAFLPRVPGRDEMGRLPHKHAGAAEAARIAESGMDRLWGT